MTKPVFIVAKFEIRESRACDDCGRLKSEVPGEWFWNPGKFAKKKILCGKCRESRAEKARMYYERWKESQGISQADAHMREILKA